MNDDPSKVDVLYAKVHEIDGRRYEVGHLFLVYMFAW